MPDTIHSEDLPKDLHYVDDSQPGFTRKILRGKFAYFDTDGQRIRDEDEIKRINALVIPPAYTDVWICADRQGHLQATGRDARGRKQYRYHPRWREIRDENKYSRMIAFGQALPKVRKPVRPGQPLLRADHAAQQTCRREGQQDLLRVSWQERRRAPAQRY